MSDISTIVANLRIQDNRITSNPVFIIQQKRRYVVPEGYSDKGEWYDSDACSTVTDSEVLEILDKAAQQGDEHLLPKRYHWVWYQDRWEFVQPFFTEQGAKDYLAINSHNLREPRIYVESGYRNEEWETIRQYLMGLKP